MRRIPLRDRAHDMFAHRRMTGEITQRRLAIGKFLTTRGIEPGENADKFAVLARYDRILQRR